jgi:type IV secretion system protein VirB11
VTDLYVNRPGELWVERLGGAVERVDVPALDETNLWRLARQVASLSHQGVSREHPLLSAVLPDGARVQIVASPATRGGMAMAIRKHVVSDLTLADYAGGRLRPRDRAAKTAARRRPAGDARRRRRARLPGRRRAGRQEHRDQRRHLDRQDHLPQRPPQGSPARPAPRADRGRPEIRLVHPNAVGLVAVRGEQGEARVGAEDLLQASLRLRPDRIILGELRGAEAFSFLRAVSSGHPGSMTTVHADDPRGAVEQLALMALQAGANLRRAGRDRPCRARRRRLRPTSPPGGVRAVREVVFIDR